MAASTLVDLVKIQALSTGSGPITLGPAVSEFRGVEALTNGATYSYSVQQNGNYEAGTGVYLTAGNQLVRSPLISSNGNAPIDLQANAAVVFTALAADFVDPGEQGISSDQLGADTGAALVGTATSVNLADRLVALDDADAALATLIALRALKSANLSDLADVAAARINLGIPYRYGLNGASNIIANEVLLRHIVCDAHTIVANFVGCLFVSISANPTANPWVGTFARDGTTIGTLSITSAGAITFATTGGLVKAVNAGQVITFTGPALADATLAGLCFTVRGLPA